MNPRFFMADDQAVITSRGVLRTSPPVKEGDPKNVNCPACGSGRVEMWMRATVFPNDPMTCGDCGHFFIAADIPGMWSYGR